MTLEGILTVIIAALSLVVVVIIASDGFFMKREREIAALVASQKAIHKRLDRIENKLNGALSTEH